MLDGMKNGYMCSDCHRTYPTMQDAYDCYVKDRTGGAESGEEDVVHRPAHYNQGKIECIDAIEAAVSDLRGITAVYTANIIKYVWRWDRKNRVQDLHKARWYLDRLISAVEIEGK